MIKTKQIIVRYSTNRNNNELIDVNLFSSGYTMKIITSKEWINIPHPPHYHDGEQILLLIDGYAEFGYKENERVSIFSLSLKQ